MQLLSSISNQLPLLAHGDINLGFLALTFLMLFLLCCIFFGVGVYFCQSTWFCFEKEAHQRITGACLLILSLVLAEALLCYSGLILLMLLLLCCILFGVGVYFCSTQDRFTAFCFKKKAHRRIAGVLFVILSLALAGASIYYFYSTSIPYHGSL
jgi:hypothetical protein